jgi:hypothetical protein
MQSRLCFWSLKREKCLDRDGAERIYFLASFSCQLISRLSLKRAKKCRRGGCIRVMSRRLLGFLNSSCRAVEIYEEPDSIASIRNLMKQIGWYGGHVKVFNCSMLWAFQLDCDEPLNRPSFLHHHRANTISIVMMMMMMREEAEHYSHCINCHLNKEDESLGNPRSEMHFPW